MGRNSTTLNAFFVGQVGDDPTIDSLEFQYNWQFKHELSHRIALGVEAFGEIDDLSHPGSFSDQLHRAGPVIYLDLGKDAKDAEVERRQSGESEPEHNSEAPKLNIAAGVLFGLSEATSDVTFKLDAEFEF